MDTSTGFIISERTTVRIRAFRTSSGGENWEIPILETGSLDGSLRIWHGNYALSIEELNFMQKKLLLGVCPVLSAYAKL